MYIQLYSYEYILLYVFKGVFSYILDLYSCIFYYIQVNIYSLLYSCVFIHCIRIFFCMYLPVRVTSICWFPNLSQTFSSHDVVSLHPRPSRCCSEPLLLLRVGGLCCDMHKGLCLFLTILVIVLALVFDVTEHIIHWIQPATICTGHHCAQLQWPPSVF